MATPSYVESSLGGIDATLKRALKTVFEYVLSNIRFGPIDNDLKSENFAGRFYTGTTAAIANAEFSVKHELQVKPKLLIPVLDPLVVNAVLPDLTVSKAADLERVYLKSSKVSATFAIYLEP